MAQTILDIEIEAHRKMPRNKGTYVSWSVLPSGDLILVLEDDGRKMLEEMKADEEVNLDSLAAFGDFISHDITENSELEWIGTLDTNPYELAMFGDTETAWGPSGPDDEDDRGLSLSAFPLGYRQVGAWADEGSAIVQTRFEAQVESWYYEPYQVRSPHEDLLDKGYALFKRYRLSLADVGAMTLARAVALGLVRLSPIAWDDASVAALDDSRSDALRRFPA